jgi:hypothetical protein
MINFEIAFVHDNAGDWFFCFLKSSVLLKIATTELVIAFIMVALASK